MQAILTKYSRHYPKPSSSSMAGAQADWQHYSNPTIHIALNIEKIRKNEVKSAKLRISWSMQSGGDAMDVDQQQEVVFEDLDLLSFASLNKNTAHGPPLKALYRDTSVGIRYQYPREVPLGSAPTYRRFQVVFESPEDTNRFMEALRPICPCTKSNAPNAPNNTSRAPTLAPPRPRPSFSVNRTQTQRTPANTLHDAPPAPAQPSQRQPLPRTSTLAQNYGLPPSSPPIPSAFSSSQAASQTAGRAYEHDIPSSSPALEASAPTHQNVRPQSSGLASLSEWALPTSTSSVEGFPTSEPIPKEAPSSHPVQKASSALPEPSQNSSNTIGSTEGIPPPPPREYNRANVEPLLQSIRETTNLYDLSTAELEELVSEVIWEDGFEQLVANIEKMWFIHSRVQRY